MGALLAGLLGGSANALGQYQDQKKARNQQMSDEEREQTLNDHNNTIQGLQHRMTAAEAAGDKDSLANLRTQMNQVVSDRTALFHPDNGPGALAHLGRLTWERIHGKPKAPTTQGETPEADLPNTAPKLNTPALPADASSPATPSTSTPGMTGAPVALPAQAGPVVTQRPQTPADIKQRLATDLGYGTPPPPVNALAVHRKALADAGFTPEQTEKAMNIFAGIEAKPIAEKPETWTPYGKPVESTPGVFVQPFRSKDGTIENRPLPEGYKPPPSATHPSNAAVQRAEYAKALGKSPEELDFNDEQNMIRLVKQAGAGSTVGTHIAFEPQTDGTIKAIKVQTTSAKNYGGVQPQATTPPGSSKPSPAAPSATSATTPSVGSLRKKAATVKSEATKSKAGVVQNGDIVGGRMTGPEQVAKKAVDTAESAYSDIVKASKNPTSLGDKGIVLNWLRGRVNRVTQSEINSVNTLGGAELALDNGIARVVKGEMSDTQRQWFLRSAQENLETAKQVYSKYPSANAGSPAAAPATGMVQMRAPNGMVKPVPADQVDHYLQQGATVVK